MPKLQIGGSRIHYEEYGSGYPVFLLAPGFLSSRIERWSVNPANPGQPQAFLSPIDGLSDRFRLLALDIRNAGESRGPVGPTDSWDTYVEDFLGVIDHLGIERLHVMGACIGVTFAFALAEARPGLVSALVLQNPIGLHGNRQNIDDEFAAWAEAAKDYPEVDAANLPGFHQRLFGNDFLFGVSREFVASCDLPILLMPGSDTMHPQAISEEIAALAPQTEIVDPWKGDDHKHEAMDKVRDFLVRHQP
ncbi:alpha/beta hydrolase [Microbaculum marinum]|uniref:Alpha/beta hydrolase n=1 Tax=Microbaculum marinum TaxID=1764581 RepID=A0AAW9RRG7_9HYPH